MEGGEGGGAGGGSDGGQGVTDSPAPAATSCPKCQYDRTGLAADVVCPECGGEPPRVRIYESLSSERLTTIAFRLSLFVTAMWVAAVALALTVLVWLALDLIGRPGEMSLGIIVITLPAVLLAFVAVSVTNLPNEQGEVNQAGGALVAMWAAGILLLIGSFLLPARVDPRVFYIAPGAIPMLLAIAAGLTSDHAMLPHRVILRLPVPKTRQRWSVLVLAVLAMDLGLVTVGIPPASLTIVGSLSLLACLVDMAIACRCSVTSIRQVLKERGN